MDGIHAWIVQKHPRGVSTDQIQREFPCASVFVLRDMQRDNRLVFAEGLWYALSNPLRGGVGDRRGGFTLIELLVVMAIIALLISLLSGAVLRARNSANQTVCRDHLKNLALATILYESQQGYLPASGNADDFAAPVGGSFGWNSPSGPLFAIMPNLDNAEISAGQNGLPSMVGTAVNDFNCPSRRTVGTGIYQNAAYPSNPQYGALLGQPISVMQTDYAFNGGSNATAPYNGITQPQAPGGRNVCNLSTVSDSLAFTILIGEKAANVAGGPMLNLDDQGFASPWIAQNYNSVRLTSAMPVPDSLYTPGLGGAFGSAHPNGLNIAFCDGHVATVSYTVTQQVWTGLGTRNGNEAIGVDQLQ